MKHLNQFFALVATAIISISSLNAAVRTWTGANSTSWSSNSNWSGGAAPTSTDTAIIPASVSSNRSPVIGGSVSLRRFVMNGLTVTYNGTRTLNVSGEMVINAGTFTSGGAITAGNFTLNGGTFNSNTNSVAITNYLIINNGLFNNGSASLTADFVEVNNGELRVRSSSLNPGTLVTLDGGLITNTSTQNPLDFTSDFSFLSGTIDMNFQGLNVTGLYYFVGGSLIDPGTLITAADVEIDYTGTHTMGISVRVTGSMKFTSGILESSSADLLIFDNNATVTGASDASHVNGPVRKEMNTGTTPDFVFPIGNGSYYAPLGISSMAVRRNEDYFTATYFGAPSANANSTVGSGLNLVSKVEYWVLDRAATSGTATTTAVVTLSYNTSRSGPITNAALLKVARWNGSSWADHGRSTSSSTSNTAGNVISSAAVTSFSPFTLGSSTNVNPLPISLLNFNAKAISNAIEVKWTTTSEINNDYFTIEKSFNGSEWLSIATVKGAGNSEVMTNYENLDLNPVNGVQYYRLKQTDINGDFTYSAVVAVVYGKSNLNNTLTMYPIPANTVLNIESSMDLSAGAVVNVYNAQGSLVMTLNSNENQLKLDIQNLESGIYFVEINTGAEIVKSKFQKL